MDGFTPVRLKDGSKPSEVKRGWRKDLLPALSVHLFEKAIYHPVSVENVPTREHRTLEVDWRESATRRTDGSYFMARNEAYKDRKAMKIVWSMRRDLDLASNKAKSY